MLINLWAGVLGFWGFGWTWLILIGAVWTFTVAYFWKVKIPVNVTKPEEI